jgi:hypothetical protein
MELKWIPTGERLPKEQEIVLFVTKPDGCVECGSRSEFGWSVAYDMYYGDHWEDHQVTHWMPMPEGPSAPPAEPDAATPGDEG